MPASLETKTQQTSRILTQKSRSNQLASEKIYEYFSKHAGIHDMDENLFEIKVNDTLEKAKSTLKAKTLKIKNNILKKNQSN